MEQILLTKKAPPFRCLSSRNVRINRCCAKTPTLWQFVMTALRNSYNLL